MNNAAETLRVLIVDDDPMSRRLMRRRLLRTRARVDVVEDGVTAIDRLTTTPYTVVLLDIVMPRMSGVDVLRWIKRHPDITQRAIVIVTTAEDCSETAHDCRQLGAFDVLLKPLSADVVRQRVMDAHRVSSARASLPSAAAAMG